jgi:mannose-6-phosphate isomerase-like protein (cupin superfamily)
MSYPDPVYFGAAGETSASLRRADTPPDPHFHRTMSEYFFVLSGTVRLYDGSAWVDGKPGDFLHVPPGGVHGFRNESGAPASMLLMFTPGGPREAYLETLKKLGEGLTMTDEEKDAFYAAQVREGECRPCQQQYEDFDARCLRMIAQYWLSAQ